MSAKFIAYYNGKKINAYEGLRLKTERLISTSPVSNAVLFDSLDEDDRYPVSPHKGKLSKKTKKRGRPYFVYYPNNAPGNIVNNKEGINKTLAHDLFQNIFSTLSEFDMHLRYMSKDSKIEIKVKSSGIDRRIKVTNTKTYVVDILLNLEETYPYSYYYKWNGQLALEISVSSIETFEKVSELSKYGLQVCELRVPKSIIMECKEATKGILHIDSEVGEEQTVNSSDETPVEEYNKLYSKYYELFKTRKFKAFAIELGSIETKDGWRERYENMSKYEEQVEKMNDLIKYRQAELDKLNNEISNKQDKLTVIKKEYNKIENYVETKNLTINKLNTDIMNEKKQNATLHEELEIANKSLKELQSKKDELTEKVEKLENKSLWKKILKWKNSR